MTNVPPPGAHGGDGAALARALGIDIESVLDLSMSLNPCAPDVSAMVARGASAVMRYPEPATATDALAAAMQLPAERIVLTNGGAEAIALVAAEQPAGRVDDPDFSLYAHHLKSVSADAPRWRSNPNNPTGRLAGPADTAGVWDEAFYPVATGRWTRGDRDTTVVGSLTKLFACPGLRLGYVIAPTSDLADRLRSRQPEWSVNAIACTVLPTLLEHADLHHWSKEVTRLRAGLVDVLHAASIATEPSDANFVLAPAAPGLRAHLAARAVLVRDTASFGIAGGARIAVPDDHGLDRLAAALEGYRP
jgi:histidinol-phosphate/aromatic aminotransferase/cobyric acid decarboxylase-like protein